MQLQVHDFEDFYLLGLYLLLAYISDSHRQLFGIINIVASYQTVLVDSFKRPCSVWLWSTVNVYEHSVTASFFQLSDCFSKRIAHKDVIIM